MKAYLSEAGFVIWAGAGLDTAHSTKSNLKTLVSAKGKVEHQKLNQMVEFLMFNSFYLKKSVSATAE